MTVPGSDKEIYVKQYAYNDFGFLQCQEDRIHAVRIYFKDDLNEIEAPQDRVEYAVNLLKREDFNIPTGVEILKGREQTVSKYGIPFGNFLDYIIQYNQARDPEVAYDCLYGKRRTSFGEAIIQVL